MNLKAVKREPVEVTENETSSFEEVKQLNITQEEADVIEGFDKLNIKDVGLKDGEDKLQERGPTGGVPVGYAYPMEKHIPVGPPLLSNYASPQMYQQPQPNYAAQHGRRMLDEPDQPPRKFVAAPNFNPQLSRQMQQYDVNNLNQGHMPPMFSPNMTYNPNQMFGMPQPAEKISLTMKNSTSGGTVTVTSPELPLPNNPFEDFVVQNQNIADDLIDGLDDFQLTQNCGGLPQMSPNMTQMTGPVTNINQTGPLGHPTSQPYMPMSSQMSGATVVPVSQNIGYNSNYNQEFTGQSFRDPHTRRRSDPSDSGMESAGEASPYPESTPSPNGSTYTSPPSVDSGCERSPKYEPFSPGSSSQGSVGGSPPKYTGMVTSPGMYSEMASPASSGIGSPDTPLAPTPISANTNAPVSDNFTFQENNINEPHSEYIDKHLEGLQDALGVIADDIRLENQRKLAKKNSGSQGGQQKRPVSSENSNFQPILPPQNNDGKMPLVANFPPATTMVQAVPPATSTVTTIIFPPQQPLVTPAQQQPMVLVPMVPGQTAAPLIICNGLPKGTQNTPPPKRAPRKILPKMPASVNAGGQNGTNTTQSPGGVPMPNPAQPAGKNIRPQSQQNIQGNFTRLFIHVCNYMYQKARHRNGFF